MEIKIKTKINHLSAILLLRFIESLLTKSQELLLLMKIISKREKK